MQMSKSSEALKLFDEGHTVTQAAEMVGTSRQTVYTAIHRRKVRARNFKPILNCPTCHQLLPTAIGAVGEK